MIEFRSYINEATTLIPSELKRYPERLQTFLGNIKAGKKFELVGGGSVKLKLTPELSKALKSGKLEGIQLVGLDGKPVAWGSLKKTAEFDGKDGDNGTSHEVAALSSINRQLKNIGDVVSIKVGGKIFKVTRAKNKQNTPKSDFEFLDAKGEPVIWISHKNGLGPRDFNQFGGVTNPGIANHSEVEKFIKDMQRKYGKKIPNKTNARRKIKDNKLKMKAVFGIDYGKELGPNNVSAMIQGPIKLVKKGSHYEFEAANIFYNGDKMTGDYEPVLMIMYRGDRNNGGIQGARLAIYPLYGRGESAEWV